MNLAHYALVDLGRRPSRALVITMLLALSMVALLGTLAYSRAVAHRLAAVEGYELRRVGVVEGLDLGPELTVPTVPGLEREIGGLELDLLYSVLRAQPGVELVALATATDGEFRSHQLRPAAGDTPGLGRYYDMRFVNRDYVDLLPMVVVEGRWLARDDWRADGSLQRPLPAVVNRGVRGVAVGDRLTLWRGPVIGAEQVVFRIVGSFNWRDNYFLESGMGPAAFHELLQLATFDFVAPDTVIAQAPARLYARVEDEGRLGHDEFAWQGAVAASAAARGLQLEAAVRLVPLGELVDLYRGELGPRDRFAVWLTALVLALTTFGFGSLSAVSAWDRRSEWGVHFAAGARQRDVLALAFWELVWLAVVPALVVGGLVWGHATAPAAPDAQGLIPFLPATIQYLRLDGVSVGTGMGLIGLVALVAAVAPLLYLRSRTAVELVRQVR